jgi:branched-subunit amino acid transport protein
MKPFVSIGFLIPAFLFILHQILQKLLQLNYPFIDNYLDPFCFTALCIPLILIERKRLFQHSSISLLELGIYSIALLLVSEGLLPWVSAQFKSDPWDLIPLSLGILWAAFFNRKKISTRV